MQTIKIDTRDSVRNFEPGERVAVTCAWQLDETPREVEVRLVWYTSGKGDRDVSVVQAHPLEAPQAMDMRQLEITLPEGPYSFSGKLISLLWALELVAEPSGESHRIDITVAPGGSEVLLPAEKETDLLTKMRERSGGRFSINFR